MLTKETRDVIIQVANGIGPDVSDITDPEEMAEVCIDANRLVSVGDSQEAEDEVIRLIDEHGYDAVLKAIAEFVPCN